MTLSAITQVTFILVFSVSAAIGADGVTPVTVNGTTYNVTSTMHGRMLRVDDAEGHMIGMASYDGTNVSILHPQQEPGFTVVKSAVNAYLHPSNGTAAPPAPDDGQAALRERIAARTATPSAMSMAAGGPRVVKAFTDEGVVVYDPDVRADVTITPDGMTGSWIVEMNGYPPVKTTVEYEGGETRASGAKKTGKLAKGISTAVLQGLNHRANAVVNVDNDPDNSWRVKSQGSNGKAMLFESGGYRVGGSLAYDRDPAKQLGMKTLHSFRLDLETAQAAKESAAKAGQSPKFDLSSERSQRGWTALLNATKAYDLK